MNNDSELLGRRYRIEEKYSGDGYIFYKATDVVSNDRVVGIKTPNDAVMSNESALALFVKEAELQQKLEHPGLVKVLHFYKEGEIDSRCHLVTEWSDTTLDEVLEKGGVRRDEAISIIQMIIRALIHMHDNGFVHRGIEPKHILLSSNYSSVKIGNLGYAVRIGHDQTLPGRPRYEAPESYDPEWSIDQRADVYSLGFVCYELLAGREKFQDQFPEIYGATESEVQAERWLHWHLDPERRPEKLSSLDSGVDDRLSQIVAKMIEKDPVVRYQDLQEVVGAFSTANQVLGWRDEVQPIDVTSKGESAGDRKGGFRLTAKAGMYAGVVMLWIVVIAFLGLKYFADSPTDEEFIAASVEMNALRIKAVEAGADRLMLQSYTDAVSMAEQAMNAREEGFLPDAMQLMSSAMEGFGAATSEAITSQLGPLLKKAEKLRNDATRLRVDSNSEILVKAVGQLGEVRADAAGEQGMQASMQKVNSAIAGFEKAIKTLPRSFRKGSTAEEIDDALMLCNKYIASCQREWYATEIMVDTLLSPFSMDQREVTNREFGEFVKETSYQTSAEKNGYGYVWDGSVSKKTPGVFWSTSAGRDAGGMKKPDHPVTYMGFADATAYCTWRGKRVPTEAEWEYASRGLGRNQFPWGNKWDKEQLLWGRTAQLEENKPAGSYQLSSSGAQGYDYAGSVWEWVWDAAQKKAVLKGGSYRESNPANFRLASQRDNPKDAANSDDGFRCVEDVSEWPVIMNAAG